MTTGSSVDLEKRVRELLLAFEKASTVDVGTILQHFTSDAKFWIWGLQKPPSVGHDEIRHGLEQLAAAIKDFTISIEHITVGGNTVMVERVEKFTYLGKHQVTLPVVGVGGVDADGKFVVWKDYFDPSEMYSLGAAKE
ncbi:hypothetical protein Z517_03561 [Fonsecaea pedrosoi CBS 271.37]|uniref:SnoaL-like domain-containing protein n=1 Tax=Fonsecaea pedrosoi CBS 271.37 TaxID=1442368 RepID=A0A0D2E2K5_9EURO|nr:uncharacterized protein Z517_03561 [Fonsecaea pedrosoi CBS 271.37]KIW84311.1 hypothetical protein Z517_03561 [Fonsecaea pedrosoi CBS 271.37]